MRIVILGGGLCGLGCALLLARDRHDVTVLERDLDPPPTTTAGAWQDWPRKGVVQFRQPHNFMPGLRMLLERELPDVQQALADAGATRWDLVNPLPPSFTDRSPRPIDAELWTWTARRPVGEWVFARAAEREPRIAIRRGATVTALVAGPPDDGIPRVIGVRTEDGDEVHADLVVDATGRQSPAPRWLQAIGARAPVDAQADCGFTYYTRYFSGPMPQRRGPALMPIGTISILTLHGDNDTWSVTIFGATGDQPLKALRREDVWTKTVRACPMQAHWLEGDATTPVLAMSGIVDRYRRFVIDGAAVATGFVAIADAWACTNPSAGRGLTIGLKHAALLRDVLRDARRCPRHRRSLSRSHGSRARAVVRRADRRGPGAVRGDGGAARGEPPPRTVGTLAASIGALFARMGADPDLFRAALEYVGTITPVQQILGRPDVAERLRLAAPGMAAGPPRPVPGPTRQQLLDLMN